MSEAGVYSGPTSGQSLDESPRSRELSGSHLGDVPTEGHGADRDNLSTNSTAVNDGDDSAFNLERTVKAVLEKFDERDIPRRELGVAFRNLNVTVLSPTQGDNTLQPTLGSVLNPFSLLSKVQTLRHPETRDILTGFEGVVKPREMLLVLGRPGSGCTTLLKTLANQHAEYLRVSGELHYDAFTPAEIAAHFRGDVIYCPEDDIHFPTLTVRQTLDFAATTRTPHKRIAVEEENNESGNGMRHSVYKETIDGRTHIIKQETRAYFISRATDVLSRVFGLKHVLDTKVGDASIRGVSGGEKKRVSIAEALVTRALIGAWDNSTRGLDASTALEYIRALRTATDLMSLSTIVSIYQASETLYAYFDKVCVINEGKMVYFGNASAAKQYFIDMGYAPKDRQTTAGFLVAVTDPNGREERASMVPPRSAAEMAAYFRSSPHGEKNRREVQHYLENHAHLPPNHTSPPSAIVYGKRQSILPAPPYYAPKDPYAQPTNPSHLMRTDKKNAYRRSAATEKAEHTLNRSPYTISVPMQVKAVMKRRVQVLLGDRLAQALQVFSYLFQAIIMGTIFFNLSDSTTAYFSRGSVLFFAILFAAITAMAEIPALYAQRPIVSRHQRAAMYHPFIEALALTLVDVPITFVTIILFSTILYELVQLQQTVSQFFIFFLFVFILSITMKTTFRALAAAVNKEATAQALAGLLMMGLVLYTGYTTPQPEMIGALKWITIINPIRYGFEGLVVNEFHTLNGTCATLIPSGPGYENITLENQACTTVGSLPGKATVDGNRFTQLNYKYSYNHLWRNFGIILAFGIAFVAALLVFTERLSSVSTGGTIVRFARSARRRRGIQNGEENFVMVSRTASGKVAPRPSSGTVSSGTAGAAASVLSQRDLFSWQNLRYTVPLAQGGTRQLLDDVSGYVAPGKLTALMGESGAGKTTLLNVLAERISMGVVTGDRFVNGQALPSDFQGQIGYCQQMDTHLPQTTVREALLFSAKLRQPAVVPLVEKEAYVDTCLKMCGLEQYANAIVGTLGVEQRKRTTIGVELAAKPKLLLFLDEPTSGLDSQSSWAIMQFLRTLADNGQAILCTIHQPSAELFQVFDRLLLLKKGGQTVYFGDIGPHSRTLIQYFESKGGRKCATEENPAEWMLDVIGAGATATSKIDWRAAWYDSEQSNMLREELDAIHNEGRQREAVKAIHHSDFATSWLYQLKTLLERAFVAYWRNPTYLISKFFLNVAAGLFIGFTFFKRKDTIQGTQDKLFAVFMATLLSVPLANQLQSVFIDFRNIYEIRERPSKIYSWTALVASQLLVEIPYNILGSTMFFFCWYWTVGLPSSRAGYSYLAYGIVFPLYYTTIAEAAAAMSPSAVIASLVFTALFSFVVEFNGVLQPFSQLGWWKWMYKVSPFTYLIEGLVGQAIGRSQINCAPQEFAIINPPSGQTCEAYLGSFMSAVGGYLNNPAATSQCLYCASRTTDQFLLESFNIDYSHRWRNIGIVLGVTVFNIFAVFFFTYFFRIRSSFVRAYVKRKVSGWISRT